MSVYGCAVCHFAPRHDPESAAAVAAAFHLRLPGSKGAELGVLLQQLLASSKFQGDLISKGRLTVDDSSKGTPFAIHCLMSADGLVIVGCTRPDYPVRVVYPSSALGSDKGFLAQVSEVASELLGSEVFATGAGSGGIVRKVSLAPRVAQALERVCAEFEDAGAHDKVARVQSEVDGVRGIMQDNIDSMLANQELLTSLQGKTDAIAGASRNFYRDAKTARRSAECEENKWRYLGISAVAILVLLWLRSFLNADEGNTPPTSPSPPA